MAKEENKEFGIIRVYVQDVSFESPHAPEVFREDWQPELKLDLQHTSKKLAQDGSYHVSLKVTAAVEKDGKSIFLAEVEQAGIFGIVGFSEDEVKQLLSSYCLSVLFPYAREVVTDLSVRGGFPPLYLAPVNFEGSQVEDEPQQKVS